MKGVLALLILVSTGLGCAAITHFLDVQINNRRLEIEGVRQQIRVWEQSPPGRRMMRVVNAERRLEATRTLLKETPGRNAGLGLMLAAADGLGTNLRSLKLEQEEVTVEVAADPHKALQRMSKLPAASFWEVTGPTSFGGPYQP